MYNKLILVGRLATDVTMRYTPTGKAKCEFRLAVNSGGNTDDNLFITVVTWERLAEQCAQYLNVGKTVLVDGRLAMRTYEKDGGRRTVYEVVAQTVRFLGTVEKPTEPVTPPAEPRAEAGDDEDIPF